MLGHKTRFPRAAGGLLRASFASLCGQALGPQDYLAIAGRFHTLFLENVPVLAGGDRNEARRFVWLVDALYEARTRLVVLAAAARGKRVLWPSTSTVSPVSAAPSSWSSHRASNAASVSGVTGER